MSKKSPDATLIHIATPPMPMVYSGPLFRGHHMHKTRTSWLRWVIVAILVILLTLIAQGHEGHTVGPRIRLIPFKEYVTATMALIRGWEDARRWMVFVLIDGLGNLVVFMPLGAALDRALRDNIVSNAKRIITVALLGGALSAVYEITQLWIPGRVTAVDDVIINTAGAILGAVLIQSWHLRKQNKSRSAA